MKSTEEQLREQLIEEAKEGHRLITLSDQKYRKQTDIKICYLISRNWFNQWCEYVGYLEVLADIEPESDKFATFKPSRLINEEFIPQQNDKVLASNQQLFRFDERRVPENSYLNVNLKSDQNVNTFKIVDEDTWKFYSQRYPGGFEMQRPVFYYQNRIIQNVQLLQPDIVIYNEELVESINKLSDLQLKNSSNSLSAKKCQLPSFYTLAQLKDLLKRQFNVDNVRVWRCDASQKREDLQFQIGKSIKQKQFQVRAVELTDQKVGKSLVLKDMIKNHYCLIFELPMRGKFDLKQSNYSLVTSGKVTGICEYCTKHSELSVKCVCKEVAYCSSNCKYKDQDFHSRSCEVAADSESDEEMNFLPLEISGKAGLKNIGNTCYIAAALQNIYVSKEFSQMFTMNEVQKMPNKSAKLLQKFSKLLKEMSMQNEESIEPWSFKTQLGRINQMFSGNYQHDAAEFITCLIEALNEECTKEPEQKGKIADLSKPDQFWEYAVKQGYNKAIVDSFLGLYESSIECPDCKHTSTNYDPFSILSLPIKQKPIVKQIMVNLIKANILEEVSQTRATYTTGKTTILELINFVCSKNKVVYSNNIAVCTYNGQHIQQSYISPKQLHMTVEELEVELEGKNKSLLFYEVNFDTTLFDPLKHKLIKLDFARIGKIQIGIMQVDEKTNFSAPRVVIIDKSQNLSSIYVSLFEQLKEIYPDACHLVQESFAEFKEIKSSETDLSTEQQNKLAAEQSKSEEQVKLEEQKRNEDIKWNGTSESPEKVQSKQKQQQTSTISPPKQQQQSQTISPPKQQQQQISQSSVISSQNQVSTNDGWGDYDIVPILNTKQQGQKQKSQAKEAPQTQQKANQSASQQSQNQVKQQETKKEIKQQVSSTTPTSQSLNSTNATTTNISQSAQSVSSNDGGWGWDSEIIVSSKKVVAVVPAAAVIKLAETVQQSAQYTTNVEQDAFTQVTQNKKGNRQNANKNNDNQQYSSNNHNNKKYQDNNNKNNSNNSQKVLEPSKQVNNTTKQQAASNGNQQKQTVKQQQPNSNINNFAGWGEEEVTPVVAVVQAQTNTVASQQVTEKVAVDEQKQNTPTQQTDNANEKQQYKPKVVIKKEDFTELINKLPFSLNIKSKKRRTGGVFKCFFCGKQNCQSCVLPYENQRTLQQLLSNYRDIFEFELFWQKEQPSKSLYKSIIDQNQANSQAKKQNFPTIQYCLEEFSQKEQLSKENQWFCSKCMKDQQAFKRLSIKYCPNNLIIQIKRFKTNPQDGSKEKNYQQVIFPEYNFQLSADENIEASPSISSTFQNKEIVYDLYGVIVHEGTTENGHYIAHCKYDKLWFSFDDDNITIIDADKVLNNKNAYILFYRLRK